MENTMLIDVFQHMLFFTTMAILIILTPGLIVGFIVSIFQAATQINEVTLSFLPKLVTMMAVLGLLAPWLFHRMVEYTESLIMNLKDVIS